MSDGQACLFTPHHVGVVVSNLGAAMDAYIANFGYTFFHFEVNQRNAQFTGASAAFTLRFGIGQLGASVVELIEPLSGTTLYSQHLAEKGPGLHHLAFSVLDLDAARAALTGRGYNCLQNGNITDLVDFSYYEAAELGCIVEPLSLRCDFPAFLLQNAQPYQR